jgi:hypothetical protein
VVIEASKGVRPLATFTRPAESGAPMIKQWINEAEVGRLIAARSYSIIVAFVA